MTDRQMALLTVHSMEQFFTAWLLKNDYSIIGNAKTTLMLNSCFELVEEYMTREEFCGAMLRHIGKDGKVCMQ